LIQAHLEKLMTPDRQIYGSTGHARLIDFGLSAIVRPLLGQSHLAVSSIRPGAIRYAAPELVLSDDAHDLPLEKLISILLVV
jgi:hypothetical protein